MRYLGFVVIHFQEYQIFQFRKSFLISAIFPVDFLPSCISIAFPAYF